MLNAHKIKDQEPEKVLPRKHLLQKLPRKQSHTSSHAFKPAQLCIYMQNFNEISQVIFSILYTIH